MRASLDGGDASPHPQSDEPRESDDIELGGLDKGKSEKDFKKHAEEQAAELVGKPLGADGAVTDLVQEGVNVEAMGRVLSGGIAGLELERLSIAINYLQNFGLVLVIDIPWPEAFKKWWSWVETLGLDFNVFGGMGEDVSIALGLLVPAWLVWEFDTGLFWERTYFGFYWMGNRGDNFKTRELDSHEFKVVRGGFKGFTALGLGAAVFVALAFASVLAGWIANDLANAFLLVLSGLSLLSFLHQIYLWRETKVCESANEDFAKKRQENEMFFFLFFYTVAYLSGVSACMKLLLSEETAEKVVGGILLPFYVLVPLWKLRGGAASVKAAVKEAASEEGHKYKEIKFGQHSEIIETTGTKVIGGGEVSTYQDSLGIFSKKAVESKINEHRTRRSSGGGRLF
ncbi:hypothetical protein TrST_g7045 [Triparma strigata]|uniref:Uncharacterized protein n=1 Tax=Triparma strigata TaxID=1606541 RepID=A0A9W7BXD3_9STRA|nr:hypothetical protein TrST_g7045 [Triparma strigata]